MAALTYYRVKSAVDCSVIVAIDDLEVEDTLRSLNIPTIMTSKSCVNGTERVHEVATKLPMYDRYINVQADEPLLNPECLRTIFATAKPELGFNCAVSLCESQDDDTEVKVAVSSNLRIRYCSRSPVPFTRQDVAEQQTLYKIHGIYCYTKAVLDSFVSAPPGPLELKENVEQLRCIEYDIPIHAVIVPASERSIDTPDDYEIVASLPASLFTLSEPE